MWGYEVTKLDAWISYVDYKVIFDEIIQNNKMKIFFKNRNIFRNNFSPRR